jgi:hypothetical protein
VRLQLCSRRQGVPRAPGGGVTQQAGRTRAVKEGRAAGPHCSHGMKIYHFEPQLSPQQNPNKQQNRLRSSSCPEAYGSGQGRSRVLTTEFFPKSYSQLASPTQYPRTGTRKYDSPKYRAAGQDMPDAQQPVARVLLLADQFGKFFPPADSQLRKHAVEVAFNRSSGDSEFPGDFLVRSAAEHQCCDGRLPAGQLR